MKTIASIVVMLLSTPALVFGAGTNKDFRWLTGNIIDVVSTLTTVVFVLVVLAIIWGVIKGWIINGGEAEGIESGKRVAFIGVIVLVITASFWGILALIQSSLFN